jgi:hypothetical protein
MLAGLDLRLVYLFTERELVSFHASRTTSSIRSRVYPSKGSSTLYRIATDLIPNLQGMLGPQKPLQPPPTYPAL